MDDNTAIYYRVKESFSSRDSHYIYYKLGNFFKGAPGGGRIFWFTFICCLKAAP